MTIDDVHKRVFECLYGGLTGGLYVFEEDGGSIGILGAPNDSGTRTVFLLELHEAQVEVVC